MVKLLIIIQLKTHPEFFESNGQEEEEEATMSVIAAATAYVMTALPRI